MPTERFVPTLFVHHERRIPQPILPINYNYFLEVKLALGTNDLPLKDQMELASTVIRTRRRYRFDGPFGRVTGYALRSSPNVTVYLNAEGEFAGERQNLSAR